MAIHYASIHNFVLVRETIQSCHIKSKQQDKECMGIMNYHCFNKLRESCPVQTPNPQMKISPTMCAEPLLSLMFVLANFLLSPLLDPAIPSVMANVCSDPG